MMFCLARMCMNNHKCVCHTQISLNECIHSRRCWWWWRATTRHHKIRFVPLCQRKDREMYMMMTLKVGCCGRTCHMVFFVCFFTYHDDMSKKTIKLNENHMHISIKCAYEHENIWISTHNYKILIILTQCIVFYAQYRNFIKIMMNIHFYVSFTFMNFVLISCFI